MMTTTYDPTHPQYTAEADVREELTRAYDICHGCRSCVDLCSSFPTLFEMIDGYVDHDAGRMTPADQDQVVDECFQCKLCALNCPYVPALHDLNLDFPQLMLRATAMQHDNGITSIRARRTAHVMGHTDLVGRAATVAPRIANWLVGAKQGSTVRKALSAATGVSSVRLLPPFARQRFSTWFNKRAEPTGAMARGQIRAAVTIFPTCFVEYQATDLGKDLVTVYERNGIDCSVSDAGCCGAPWLHSGDVKHFTKLAKRNISTLAAEIRGGTDVVVPQPMCSFILKHDYLRYLGGADALLVAEHTYDASEYLMNAHTAEGTPLDTDFTGDAIEAITYHPSGHLMAQNIGFTGRDLMELTGATVTVIQQCSGADGMWGVRGGNERTALSIASKLGKIIEREGGDIVAGDSHLVNMVIIEQTGLTPQHPIQVIARAYGIPTVY